MSMSPKQVEPHLNLLDQDDVLPMLRFWRSNGMRVALVKRIAAMFEQQRRFVADAAHELRTPITALLIQAENLERARSPQQHIERFVALKGGIHRTAHLLEQLLTLAAYDVRRDRPTRASDMGQIARRVIDEMSPIAHAKAVTLDFVCLGPIWVGAEDTAIAVIVRNLVDNAVRYTPPSGRVEASLCQQAAAVLFTVEDTGPGIPDTDISRVFDPFYRASGLEQDGTGLGLSIVRKVVEALSGSIVLTNRRQPSSGLQVSVTLPASDPHQRTSNDEAG